MSRLHLWFLVVMSVQNINFVNLMRNNLKFCFLQKFLTRNYASAKPKEKIDDKCRLYCFGLAEHGALGIQKEPQLKLKRSYKKPVRHFFAEENCVTNASAGYGFSAFSVLSNDTFKVFGCGINSDFQIGLHESPQKLPLDVILKPVPINIGLSCPDTQITALSAGRAHLAILTDKEGVFLSGSNCYGQCGREIIPDDKVLSSFIVNRIDCLGGEAIIDVHCGQDHTFFITNCSKLWSCGWSCDGQTGLGHTQVTPFPCPVGGDVQNEKIIKVTGKCDTVLALNDKGEVFGWGSNEYHQLSDEKDLQQINTPRKLDFLCCFGKIVDIASGGSFSMILNDCGDVFVWGYGILGGGPELQKSTTPFQLPRTLFGLSHYQPDVKVIKISCGLSHLATINNYGHLYMWGKNRDGCLGIGHVRDQYFPYKVALSALAEKVSCGVDHTVVLCKPF